MSEQTELITCYKCGSTNWGCFDESSDYCWDKDGSYAGIKVTGYLYCKEPGCEARWSHSYQDDEFKDCTCEDDY